MAHPEQMWFFNNCRNFFPRYFTGTKVLEIGALNINGTVRDFFSNSDYTGIDVGPGPCVDQVCMGEDYPAAANTFDVVLSTEVFEHAQNWDLIFLNMLRLVKRDGLIMFSCASYGRPQHGTRLFLADAAPHIADSTDYYRNLGARDFREILNFDYWFSSHAFVEDLSCLYFVGQVRGARDYVQNMESFTKAYNAYLHKRHVLGLPHDYILANNLL